MTALGLSVSLGSVKPRLACVLLDGDPTDLRLIDSFDLSTGEANIEGQVHELGRALSSKLSGIEVDVAVIRVADHTPVAKQTIGTRTRLTIEGALIYVCQESRVRVRVLNGREIGKALSLSKDEAIALGADIDKRRKDAAAAALAGL